MLLFCVQAEIALAGTTGSLAGQVSDEKGVPIANALVKAVSPSETTSSLTDAHGHFTFLNLAPDTYTVTATKDGYQAASYAGQVVFADNALQVSIQLNSASLKTIAKVSARASGSLVRPGTTVNVYAVNAATASQLAMSGGGNNLDSAYSAIYSQPGVLGLPGNYGFGQVFFIHGSGYNQVGYEFDGIPVNRSFDNYNANSLSNLGAESTEVYTGGGPASATSPTLGGYINQVIRTGTFPGFADADFGLGAPAFYHKVDVEAGGATPDRLFSYYVGLRGSDMIPNQIDENNGDTLNPDGNNQYGAQGIPWNTMTALFADFGLLPGGTAGQARGPWSDCNANGSTPAGGSYIDGAISGYYTQFKSFPKLPACNAYNPLFGTLSLDLRGNDLSDRENVANFHVGVPHKKDSGRDDIQFLFDNFYYQTSGWDNFSTNAGLPYQEAMLSPAVGGGGLGYYGNFAANYGVTLTPYQMPQYPGLCAYYNFTNAFGFGNPPCASSGGSPGAYYDAYQVHANFGQSATGKPDILSQYYFPSTSTDRPFQSGFSQYQVSNTNNNGSIVKLQYTHNIGSSAFVRIFGYTFYSDWVQTDPNFGVTPFLVGGATAGDYELNTHTRGLDLQASDQLNTQNLLSLTGSYTTASVTRWNNQQYTFQPSATPIATLMGSNGMCYAAYNNNTSAAGKAPVYIDPGYGNIKAGAPVSCLSALAGAPIAAVQTGGCAAGAAPFSCLGPSSAGSWQLTQNLAPDGNINTVTPKFFDTALQDEFRPTDKWDINIGVRFESYGYGLGDYSSPSQQFWFNEVNATVCVDPSGLEQVPASDFDGGGSRYLGTPSGYPSFYTTAPGQPCAKDPLTGHQLYHPGQSGIPAITLGGAGTITNTSWSPRAGFTYTMGPNSVIRFSYGRYTQPTPTADEQVLTYPDGYKMATSLYESPYYNNGLSSIVHDNPIQFSNNWDASFEQHLPNTDVTFKLSPYYRYTSNQSVEVPLPGGLAGSFNSGTEKVQGIELAAQKGDPSRNGFSGQLSYTYTDAQIKYALINGSNIVATLLNTLKPFLALEGINGGSPCYVDSQGVKNGTSFQGAGVKNCNAPAIFTVNGVKYVIPTTDFVSNPYYGFNITEADLNSQYPLTGFYPYYANNFPNGLQGGDANTIIPPNVFAGFLSFRHNKLQAALTGNLWEGTTYGAPNEIAGINPTACGYNQNAFGITPHSQLADYQSCAQAIAIPNPVTAKFDNVGQYRNPWDLNLGAQIGYDLTPRIKATVQLANIFTTCFGGSAEPWTAAFPPNRVVCAYEPNTGYLGWSPGEAYNTAGAGFFWGNNPHQAVNGTTGYPKLFDQAYAPAASQIASPFQAYFQVQVKI